MATQFYRTLDDILKLKQQNQEMIQDKLTQHDTTNENYDDELARLRANMKQLGVSNEHSLEQSIEDKFIDKSKRLEFIREHNIKHGSPRWFRVMYARPDLTGEDPFGE